MLWIITIILYGFWLAGMLANLQLGGFLHILLVLAVMAVIDRFGQQRRLL
jgi:hypothetical protein